MKYLLLLMVLYSSSVAAQKSVYDLSIRSAKSETVSLADYKGKKLVIVSISPASLQKKELISYWDSLQAANPKVAVIVIPTNDLKLATDTASATEKPIVSDKVTITSPVHSVKNMGIDQDPLMYWLTHVDQNTHFDLDIVSDNVVYVISESGILYALLENGVSAKVMDEILKQADIGLQYSVADPDIK